MLLVVLSCLCIEGVWDVARQADEFPLWFAPSFALGNLVLILVAVYAQRAQPDPSATPSPRVAALIFALVGAALVICTGMHSFFPFRADVAEFWEGWPTLRFNLVLAVVGVVMTSIAALLQRCSLQARARLVLTLMSFVLLIPNDTCPNPFNTWWLETVGASPLMYVPVSFAAFFAMRALRGAAAGVSIVMLLAICVATACLVVGHRTRLLW